MPRSAASVPTVVVAVCFAAAAWLVYRDVLPAPFVYDDARLVGEPLVRIASLGGLVDLLSAPGVPRKIGLASFALNVLSSGRLDPTALRATNVVLHVLNGLLLLALLRLLAGRLETAQRPSDVGLALGALVWLLHPVQTQGVTYVWQRFTCLVTTFVLLAVLAFARGFAAEGARRGAWWAAAALAGVLALGTKENAGMLPVLLLLTLGTFYREEGEAGRRRRVLVAALGLAFLAAAAWYLGPRALEMIVRDSERRGFTPLQRVMTEWRVIAHYVGLVFFPHPSRLRLDYDFPLSTSLLAPPTTLVCGLVLAAVAIVGARWRRTRPLESFAILWFLANLVIESTVIPLDLVYEHRLYLPVSVPIAVLVARAFDRVPRPAVALGATVALCILLGVWSHRRNEVWRDPVTFWADNVAKSPARALSHWNLAREHLVRGDHANARRSSLEAIRLDPTMTGPRSNLAVIAMAEGKHAEARAILEELLRIDPRYQPGLVNLGLVEMRLGQPARAVPPLARAVANDPDDETALRSLVAAHLAIGQAGEAVAIAEAAVARRPTSALRQAVLGASLVAEGDVDRARAAIGEALRLDPGNALAREHAARLDQALPR